MLNSKKILFLGCGKMGSIIVRNLIEHGIKASHITIIDPKESDISGVKYFKNFNDLSSKYKADLVFIAIKPQDAQIILSEFKAKENFSATTIFISILAGKKIAFFENIFGRQSKIIRSMPNLPIEDSQGVFAYKANQNISSKEIENLQKIFANFGSAIALKDEKLFDVITAIFGSGPAYLFYLQEIFTKIAIAQGVNKDEASELVKTLFLGSSLMACNSRMNFAELCDSVTSKGGTTEAALKILQEENLLENLITKAIKAAQQKSEELSE